MPYNTYNLVNAEFAYTDPLTSSKHTRVQPQTTLRWHHTQDFAVLRIMQHWLNRERNRQRRMHTCPHRDLITMHPPTCTCPTVPAVRPWLPASHHQHVLHLVRSLDPAVTAQPPLVHCSPWVHVSCSYPVAAVCDNTCAVSSDHTNVQAPPSTTQPSPTSTAVNCMTHA